jgi:tetratricopeptide (TPR) repeat protein
MKRYLLLCLGLLCLCGCATPTTSLNKLSVGMTKQEAISVMGEPTRTSATQGVEYMIYLSINPFGGGEYYVRLVGGKVDAYGRVGDFNSTHPPEAQIDLNVNTPNNGQPPPSFTPYQRAMQRGMDAFQRKDFKTAVAQLQQATKLDPDSAEAWDSLGGAYCSLGEFSEMLYAYKRANENDPRLAEPWAGMAAAYYRLGQHDKYEEALAKVRQMNPKLADALESAFKQESQKQ